VKVRVSISGHIKVEDHVDLFNVDSSSEDIRADHDPILELLKEVISLYPFFLGKVSVDRDGWEAFLSEDFVQFHGILDRLHEHDHLVEHQGVQQVSQLADLLVFLQLHIELLQPMQSQLSFIVYEDFKLVLHELSADSLHIGRHGGGEHHHLLLMGSVLEDLLDVSSHV